MARPKGTKRPGIKYLSENELKAFLKAVDASKDLKYMFMFRLILFLGLRVSEAVDLQHYHFNDESHQVSIDGKKSGRSRTYTLPDSIENLRKRYIKTLGVSLHLFPHRLEAGKHMHPETVKQAFKRYAKEAGLSGFSVHSLRHTTAMIRAKKGANPIELMQWLRHRDVKSTQIYFEMIEFEDSNNKAQKDFIEFL